MNPETKEIPPHIGDILRAAREDAGLSLADISAELHIQSVFLEAIEKLDTAALPSIGYVLGYVRAYAMRLGLDGKDSVERYKTDSQVPENLGMRDAPHFVPKRQVRLPKGFFAALTVVSFAVMLTFWYGAQQNGPSGALGTSSGLNGTNVSTEAPAPVDPDLMMFKATAPTWAEIKDESGKTLISRIFVTGESWQTDVDNNVSLSARDSGALDLYLGGERIGALGRKGIPMTDVPMPAVPRDLVGPDGGASLEKAKSTSGESLRRDIGSVDNED